MTNYCFHVDGKTMLLTLAALYGSIGISLAMAYVVHCTKNLFWNVYRKEFSFWVAAAISAALWPYFYSSTIKRIFKGNDV